MKLFAPIQRALAALRAPDPTVAAPKPGQGSANGLSTVPVPAFPPTNFLGGRMIPEALIPQNRRMYVSGYSELPNQSAIATVETIQSALRMAEGGDTRQLFALYRDLIAGSAHLQGEFAKRKFALLAQPHSLEPASPSPEDASSRDDIAQMIDQCQNWPQALAALMDSCLYPVSTLEKIFAPADSTVGRVPPRGAPLRYQLKQLSPVNMGLLCFKLPYLSPSFIIPAQPGQQADIPPDLRQIPASLNYYPDSWEPDLRFYNTFDNGFIDLSYARLYPPDQQRHIVHRNHLLTNLRDNYGGPMRAVLFWCFLEGLGRDWFSRTMERYGAPFVVANTDAEDVNKVTFLQNQFSEATKLFGLVVDKDTTVQLVQAAVAGTAEAFETYIDLCQRQQSKVIVGQTGDNIGESSGISDGKAASKTEVREDLRQCDQMLLAQTLKQQLFAQFLAINGLPGNPPNIVWGGDSAADSQTVSTTLVNLGQAGLEPTDDAIPLLSKRVGFALQRKAPPEPLDPGLGVPPSGGRAQDTPDRETLTAALVALRASGVPPLARVDNTHVDAIAATHAPALAAAMRAEWAALAPRLAQAKDSAEYRRIILAHLSTHRAEQIAAAIAPALEDAAKQGLAEAAPL